VAATGMGGLLALESAWHIRVIRVGVAYSRKKLALRKGYEIKI